MVLIVKLYKEGRPKDPNAISISFFAYIPTCIYISSAVSAVDEKVKFVYEPTEWPIRPELLMFPRHEATKGISTCPRYDPSPSQAYPEHQTHSYPFTWMVRDTVRVKCLSQEHNIMSPVKARTRTAVKVTIPNSERELNIQY